MVTNNAINVATAATGTILQGAGIGTAPTFSTATYPSTTTVSQLLYSSSANVVAGLATANSAILATNSSGVPSITTASGNWLNTSRSAFQAYVNTTITDITGDGTTYTVIFGSEAFDQGNDFNTGTGTFVAPVTGKYMLSTFLDLQGLTASHTGGQILIATTSTNFIGINLNVGAARETFSANSFSGSMSILATMTAGDTAVVKVVVSGGTKVVDVAGSGNGFSTFSGYLVC